MFTDQKYNELALEDITYEWLETCNDLKLLQKAIKLIEDDGDYFIDLKNAISLKLRNINQPKSATKDIKPNIDPIDKKEVLKDLSEWQQEVENQKQDQNIREAENYKIKGNDALRSGDFNEAILHYNSALKLTPANAIVLVNRSLANFKLKEYKRSIDDASEAVKADPKYIKSYYRRAKANIELKQLFVAALDFARILKIESDNAEVTKELNTIKAKLSDKEKNELEKFIITPESENRNTLSGGSNNDKKVKIVIQEGSDDEDRGEDELKDLKKEKSDIDDKVMDGAFEQSLEKYEKLLSKLRNPEKRENMLFKLQVFNNIAYCYKQLQYDKKVIEYTNKIVSTYLADSELHHDEELKKMTYKALLREAQSFERLENDIKALETYESILCLYPNNQQAINDRNKLISICNKHYSDSFNYNVIKNKITAKFRLTQVLADNIKNNIIKEEPKMDKKTIEEASETTIKETKTDKVHEKYKLNESDIATSISLKEKGNQAFKDNDINGAIKLYETALRTLLGTDHVSDSVVSLLDEKAAKIVVDILSNLSFAHYQNKQYKAGYEQASLAIKFAEQKEKLQYRASINGEAFIKKLIEDAQKLLDIDMKMKIINTAEDVLLYTQEYSTHLYSIDQNERMKVIGESCRALMLILNNLKKDAEIQKADLQKKETLSPIPVIKQDDPEVPSTIPAHKVLSKKNINEDLLNKTENITKKAMDELIVDFRHPTSASQFETEINSFKNNYDKLIQYLTRQDLKNIRTLYSNKQIEIKHLLKINTAVSEIKDMDNDTKRKLVDLFETLATSKNFKLTVKMLLKKEKQQLAELFERIKFEDGEQMNRLKVEYGLNN